MKRINLNQNSLNQKRILKLFIAVLIGFFLSVWGGGIKELGVITQFSLPPATAQSVRPEEASVIVYQRLPDLPKENQYISQETGSVAEDNTLISRFVRYHQYIKNRPSTFRLDWKLTLADYLGINEPIKSDRYPGSTTLTTNPTEADLKAIASLNRRQRLELVDVLVSIYNPQSESTTKPTAEETTTTQPSQSKPAKPSLSKPGDAQLLMP